METTGERERSSMEELVISFKQKIKKMGERSQNPYIRRTIVSRSETLVESVQSHQRPRYVSVGPLHRGDVNLQIIENFKWSFMYILSNVGCFGSEELSVCFRGLKELEEQSRWTYSVIVGMTSDEFVEMLFLDSCFLIFLYMDALERAHMYREWQPVEESSLSTAQTNLLSELKIKEILTRLKALNVSELDADVTPDVYILDNQIPFFIVEYTWKWFLETLHVESQLDFLGCLCGTYDLPSDMTFPDKIHHILHFFHCIFPSSTTWELYDRYYRPWIPSATELKESGIDFRLENPGDHYSLDITFKDGVIHIPETFLNEEFRTVLENLVDFEQSARGDHSTSISNYVWIMSCLLSKEADVRILSLQSSFKYEKGWDRDVQRLFQILEKRCSYWKVDDEIQTMFSQVNMYRLSRRKRWKAILQRKFCTNPWITLSVLGANRAITLFILTFLQTFFTIYSFFHPPS